MTTAIIGVGNLGSALARHLVGGGEPVALAAKDEAGPVALAEELGPLARAASVEDAIAGADAIVFAVWLDTTRELLAKDARLLADKVVVDPSNPLQREGGDVQDVAGRSVRRLNRRGPAPCHGALRQGVRHARRGRTRQQRKP